MIVGLGIDMTELARVEAVYQKFGRGFWKNPYSG